MPVDIAAPCDIVLAQRRDISADVECMSAQRDTVLVEQMRAALQKLALQHTGRQVRQIRDV